MVKWGGVGEKCVILMLLGHICGWLDLGLREGGALKAR